LEEEKDESGFVDKSMNSTRKSRKKKKVIGQMFLSQDKPVVVHANSDNIAFYNRMYDEMKSDSAKQAAIDL
jgi:ribosome-binding ATPase YchF (GTP1/OBG family)